MNERDLKQQGMLGATEVAGATGATGASEASEATGATGVAGVAGAQGAQRAQEVGTQGAQMPQRAQWPQSAQNPQRAQWPQRAQNPQSPHTLQEPQPFLPKKGNYRDLQVFKKAEVIYDLTFYFTGRFLSAYKDRTVDQMVQAARSGKQNIAEGSAAASTSSETELKLINVARASMQELLTDYEDYLRVRNLEQWLIDDSRTRQTQLFCQTHYSSKDYLDKADQRSDEALANIAITLIHQFDKMIASYIEYLEKTFVEQGGIRERMTAARLGYRGGQKAEIDRLSHENDALRTYCSQLQAEIAQLKSQLNHQ